MPAELSLQGARIWLRPVALRDAAELSRASHKETEPALVGPRVPLSTVSFERWIERLGTDEHVFTICRRGEDSCIGTVSLRRIDMDNGTAETGIGLLSPADRGMGLGREAKGLLLDYAFRVLGLHAVSCTISAWNTRSARAVERQGYRYAGRTRATTIGPGGEIGDTLVYDLLRREWEERQGTR